MLFSWKADQNTDTPLYIQLADYLRMKIMIGEIKDGTRLPGRASLMNIFGVSKTTLLSAFDLLQREGLLKSYPKSGFFITYNAEEKKVNWQSYIKNAKHRTSNEEYRFWGESDGLVNFSLSSDFDVSPYLQNPIVKASKRVGEINAPSELTKYGLTSLRESLVKHLSRMGIETTVDNVLITGETIQRLYFLYETIMNSASNFIYEKTNIINTISNIHSLGVNMVPTKMDKNGIDIIELEKSMLKYKYSPVLHVDPTDQAPTGIVMSKRRRQELVKLADKYRVPIVEIDHSANIWHDKHSLNPIKSMDTMGNVVYLGSMLKIHPFDFQLSWIVADRYLIEHLSNVFIQSGVKTNFMMQIVVDEMIRSGAMLELTTSIKEFVTLRRKKTLYLCDKYLKSKGYWTEKNCYFHFWLDFPDINIKNIFSKNKITKTIYPGYFFNKQDTSHLLLCPSCIREKDIEPTIINIKNMLEKHENKHTL